MTAFITMSDIKDEIDWEFPGDKTTEGQSNFFWQGVIREPFSVAPYTYSNRLYIADKTQGGTHDGLSDTFSNYHEYTVRFLSAYTVLRLKPYSC